MLQSRTGQSLKARPGKRTEDGQEPGGGPDGSHKLFFHLLLYTVSVLDTKRSSYQWKRNNSINWKTVTTHVLKY